MDYISTLRRIPLTYKMLIVTIAIGLVSWGILDHVQSRQLKAIFDAQLTEQLNIRAQEARVRFDNYVDEHHNAVKLSVSQKRFIDYLARNDIARGDGIKYYRQVPPWLPDPSTLRGLVQISYALLMDDEGNVREVYEGLPEPPPPSLLHPDNLLIQLSFNQSLMTNIDGAPFIVTAQPVFNEKKLTAILMIGSPLNDDFLISSQGLSNQRVTVALVSGGEQVILASNRPDDLPAGTSLDEIRRHYHVTGKSFFDAGSSDLLVQFVSLISNDEYNKISRAILVAGREQRAIGVIILLSVFASIMLWITRRTGRLTRRIADFSERVLHGEAQNPARGDELDILEERFHRLTEEVVSSQEIINRDFKFQSTISAILQRSLEPVPLDEQMERIMDAILALPFLSPQSRGCIFLVEGNPEVLVMRAQHGLPESMRSACAKVPFGNCLCGLSASDRKVIFAGDDDDHHEIVHQDLPPHGHYCVPIVSGARVIGAMNVYVEKGHQRNAEEERMLSSIANTLAGILQRHKIEMEKQQLREQLADSEKFSALGRFTANIAHQIRNPLTVIGGFTRRLHNKLAEGTKEKKYTGIVVTEVGRLERILRNVLAFARVTGPLIEECDVRDIIEKAAKKHEAMCKEQSIATTISVGDISPIHGDKEQLLEAVENLLSNAIDAMPKGGTLTVSAGTEEVRGARYAAITIKDTGIGIPEEDLGKIFEPFFSTKLLLKGAGLGLSVAKKIVEDHGGFITIDSSVGTGSTVNLFLPYNLEVSIPEAFRGRLSGNAIERKPFSSCKPKA